MTTHDTDNDSNALGTSSGVASPSNDGEQTGREASGKFAVGNSFGRGRPVGSRNRASVELERLMETDAAAIVSSVIDAAKVGDLAAAKIILDRVCPPRRGRPVAFDLPEMKTAADLPNALSGLLAAVAAGDISPDEGASVAALLEVQRKAIETAEIERRLTALEQKQAMR